MININSLLEKFSRNVSSFEIDQKEICKVIKTDSGLTLDCKQLEVKNYILYINCSPAYKNKIFIHKKTILCNIDFLFPKKIIDIR